MRRLVFRELLEAGREVVLNQDQLHYLFAVLRMQSGEKFIGIDNRGAFILQLMARDSGCAKVLDPAGEEEREPELAVRLFLPLLKGEKLDMVVQKAVELGAAELILYEAQRSVVKAGHLDNKISRLEKIAQHATQQCGRHKVPGIRGLLSLREVCAEKPGLFAWEEERQLSLREGINLNSGPSLSLLTGPEGGLAKAEAECLTGSGWTAVALGPRILRAETAAITVLACTMFARGEMG